MMSLMRELETIISLRQLSRVWLISPAPCVTLMSSLSRTELNVGTSLEMRLTVTVWFLGSFQCLECIGCQVFESRYSGGCCRGYWGRVHANLSPSIDSNFEMFDSLATFTAALPRKEKKSCGWGAKMCILHPRFWLSVSNIAYWFAASCHTLDSSELICCVPHTSALMAAHNREIT